MLEHSANVIFVVLFVVAEDEDVVQIYNNKDIGHVADDVVHEMLKGGWGVGHTKGHYEVFDQPVSRTKGCFPFVSWGYPNVVVARSDIYLGEDLCGL